MIKIVLSSNSTFNEIDYYCWISYVKKNILNYFHNAEINSEPFGNGEEKIFAEDDFEYITAKEVLALMFNKWREIH